MTAPLVSCIIPVYNGARFLAETLESVLSQTWQPLEVIVVDDGSSDETPALLQGYGSRITAFRQDNAGPAAARNRGIAAAKGAFFAFNDADDLWVPDKLARQMARLEADRQLGFCVGHAQNFWEQELADEEARFRNHPRSRPIPAYVTPTLLVRRDAIERVGGFDPALGHSDSADWFLRAERIGIQGCLLPDVLVFRRMHLGNRSRNAAGESRDEFLLTLKRKLDQRRGKTPGSLGA